MRKAPLHPRRKKAYSFGETGRGLQLGELVQTPACVLHFLRFVLSRSDLGPDRGLARLVTPLL